MKKGTLLLFVSLLFVVLPTQAANYSTMKPYDLAMKSWNSPSYSEKVEIRYYLAKNYPNTPSGLFARAWMTAYNDKSAEAARLYQQCIQKYPEITHSESD